MYQKKRNGLIRQWLQVTKSSSFSSWGNLYASNNFQGTYLIPFTTVKMNEMITAIKSTEADVSVALVKTSNILLNKTQSIFLTRGATISVSSTITISFFAEGY